MADSALVYHAKGVPDSILVGTKIFTLVSPLGKSQQLPENIVAHRNTSQKNPSFGTDIKIVCSWQLDNQRITQSYERDVIQAQKLNVERRRKRRNVICKYIKFYMCTFI